LALAMHNYESEHGRLPPAVVYGEDGEPLYSWRVLILPYVEQGPLYERFHLDEPWDSPHNIQLLPEMPAIYSLPGRKKALLPPHHTICHVFVGPATPFEDPDGVLLKAITDGTSNTLLIVEAGQPVPWTKPEDLTYAPDRPLPDLRGPFRDGIRVSFADGHTEFIRAGTDEATLRAMITRNGDETFSPDR
jgi:hypothetical protein